MDSAQQAGWPVTIMSDTLVVTHYLSSGAYQAQRSLAVNGVSIIPPVIDPSSTSAPPPAVANLSDQQKEALLAQMRQATGMNAQFAGMCLEQNGWDFDTAMKNFHDIKASIPPEAFQS